MRPTMELLQGLRTGDKKAMDELAKRYFARVYTMVRARLGPKLRQKLQSGDIVQEVFLRVLKNIKNFEPRTDASFANWLSQLVTHEIADQADFFTAEKRDHKMETEVDEQINENPDGSSLGISPESWVLLQEEQKVLFEYLEALKPREKDLILMRDIAGMTFEEIGAELSLSADAARMAFSRAKATLAELVRSSKKNPLS